MRKSVLASITAVVLCSTVVSSAWATQPLNTAGTGTNSAEVLKAVSGYSNQIEDSYNPSIFQSFMQYSSPDATQKAEEKEKQLAFQTGGATVDNQMVTVDRPNVHVTANLLTSSTKENKTYATVDITKQVRYLPKPGTTITIANQKRDYLDSTSVTRHVLTLEKPTATSGLKVTNDVIQTPAEDSKIAPLSQRNLAVQPLAANSSAKRDYNTNQAGLNYIKEINYADKWSTSSKMNPAFPSSPNRMANCTNFVSQSLYAGGLKENLFFTLNNKDLALWTWRLPVPHGGKLTGPSLTWDNADANYWYMAHRSNAFKVNNNMSQMWQGSLIYASWNGNGHKDHAMVVVGLAVKGNRVEPIIDSQSNTRHQIWFEQEQNYARNHPKVKWYGLQYYNDRW
jgi:hypothetical protein